MVDKLWVVSMALLRRLPVYALGGCQSIAMWLLICSRYKKREEKKEKVAVMQHPEAGG